MNSLLDTSICVEHLRNRSPIEKHVSLLAEDDEVVLCSIVLGELWHGFEKSQQLNQAEETLKKFIDKFISYPFDDDCSRVYGKIISDLEKQGKKIEGNDLLISAIAIKNDFCVVTNNMSHFSRVPGLKCIAWN
jgi:predicted nucleic acid-binding protein